MVLSIWIAGLGIYPALIAAVCRDEFGFIVLTHLFDGHLEIFFQIHTEHIGLCVLFCIGQKWLYSANAKSKRPSLLAGVSDENTSLT